MEDVIALKTLPVGENGGTPLRRGRDSRLHDFVRLLDAMPWWILVVIAGLTYLFLHQLAGADVETASGGVVEAAPRVIIQILADAGQLLFPLILLGEAAGSYIATRRLGPRHTWTVRGNDQAKEGGAPAVDKDGGHVAGRPSVKTREKLPAGQRAWSLELLSRMDSRRFAALAAHYYKEKGMRCVSAGYGPQGTALKLFPAESGTPSAVVQCRPVGAAWVGANHIRALRGIMDGERIGKGFYMTPGAFSRDARESARAAGITLIDAKVFLLMIKRLPPAEQVRLFVFATRTD